MLILLIFILVAPNHRQALPFSSMIYGPARLFVTPSLEIFINVMLLQVVWVVVLGLLLTISYRRGTHN
jgi:ABC-type uncharacterized transport system permease subunit